MSSLIVFFSRKGENYVSGTIANLEFGNTQRVARMINVFIGGDMFEIEMLTPYSKIYNICTQEAQVDQRENARPQLASYPESIDPYDTIYLGYPNYWGTMPMAVFSFLERYDFTGKAIMPFCTHEGSGLGSSVDDIKKICPTATVNKGLAIHGSRIDHSKAEVKNWATNKIKGE